MVCLKFSIFSYWFYITSYVLNLCTIVPVDSDFGFYRKDQLGTCDPMPGGEYPPLPPAHCPEATSYSYSSG